MRLIDADATKRRVADTFFDTLIPCVNRALDDSPTVDAVPVVRCKDCVNGTVFVDKRGAEYVDCVRDDYSVRKPTDYCSYGKRKEGADNG